MRASNRLAADHQAATRPSGGDAGRASLTDGPLLSVDEVAAHLNVPKRWVYERVQRQEITAVRLGRHLRFAPSAIDSYIRHCSGNAR